MKQLSIEQARELYALGGKAAEIAVELFPELRERKLPKTWEEYIDLRRTVYGEEIVVATAVKTAFQALHKLYLLKQEYNGGWVADYSDDNNQLKFVIYFQNHVLIKETYGDAQYFLAFKTAELRDEFAANFKELIEAAKPLLG